MIFISTGGYKSRSALETAILYTNAGLTNVELSGGLPCDYQLYGLKRLKNSTNFQVHNYFPPPKYPFVFNLASLNPLIYEKSLKHAENAMQWSVELGRPIYSFHAGYLLDPDHKRLGKRLKQQSLRDRSEALTKFIEALQILSDIAYNLGVTLLVENNPLSSSNLLEFGVDPFLMTTHQECIEVMNKTPDNIKLLVDVAHLKVSAKSLDFNPVQFLILCNEWISAYHLSDNDGTRDSNEPCQPESWFWPYIRKDLNYYSLEVYNCDLDLLVSQRDMVASILYNEV